MSDEQDLDRIIERLQILEDKEAIRGMMMRGWRALDHKDWDAWISCWAEDATFEFGRWEPLRGRRAIRETVVEAESPYLAMEHQILNMHIEVSGDRASGIGYMLFVGVANREQEQDPYLMGGPYEWDWAREEGGWQVKRMRLGVWWTQGQDALSAFNDGAQANAERRPVRPTRDSPA